MLISCHCEVFRTLGFIGPMQAITAQARQLSSTRGDTSSHSLAKLCKNQDDMMKLLVHMKVLCTS